MGELMNMRKKYLTLLGIFILAAVIISGCGSSKEPVQDTDLTESEEIDVGEIYFHEVDEEHISSTESGLMYADNEILITAAGGTTKSQMEELAEQYGAEIVGYIEQTGDYQLLFPDTSYTKDELDELRAELEKEEIIEGSSVNGIALISYDEVVVKALDDLYYGSEWEDDLQDHEDGEGKSWGIEVINTISAWDELSRNEYTNPVKVGLIDNGFDTDHEDLNFAEVLYNDEFDYKSSHGNHVAGIMAASTSDDKGICGVYPYGDGNLYGVRDGCESYAGFGVSADEENGTYYTSVISQKIAYAELILRGVKVINQSMGFNYQSNYEKKSLLSSSVDYEALLDFWETNDFSDYETMAAELGGFLNRLLEKGYDFVIVGSAGNDSDPSIGHLNSRYNSWLGMIDQDEYPDVYNRIIIVGAVNSDLEIASYSNGGERTDIYAPGGEISDDSGSGNMIYSATLSDEYGYKAGTSMAAPHVAGVAACVWAADNDLTGEEVKSYVCSSVSDRCASCKMVDAAAAVQKAVDRKNTAESENDENAAGVETETSEQEVKYAAIMGWVAGSCFGNEKVEGAAVTAVNIITGKTETAVTDSDGHFELLVPEGKYSLYTEAEGYYDCVWTNDDGSSVIIEAENEDIIYLDDWILIEPRVVSCRNYYDSDGNRKYYESYAYYDNGLLCSSTLYSVKYYSDDEYGVSGEYTFLYLYDEEGDLTQVVFGPLTISDWYDEYTGELILGYEYDDEGNYTKITIYPWEESIEQEKYGVDSSKTEEVFDKFQMITSDAGSGWADTYLRDIFADDAYTDATCCRLIYINNDDIPEIWMDYGYGYAGAEIYTYAEKDRTTDFIYVSQGTASWIEKGNILHTEGGHMGYYYDYVYEINDNGLFTLLGAGNYEIIFAGEMDEGVEGEIYLYSWNGDDVTKEEYEQKLGDAFDSEKAEDIYQNIYTYEQCRLLLEALR